MLIDRRTLLGTTAITLALGPTAAWAKPKKTKRLVVGASVPGFKLRSPKKRYVYYLKDFAFPGKPRRRNQTKHPVLLDFFRTDCEPCLRSMPELVAMHKKYEAAGLKVVLVALHEQVKGKAKLLSYLEQANLPFLVVEDPTDYVAERYLGKTVSLPATFLIDENAKLLAAKYDAKTSMQEAFGPKIDALLAAKKPKEPTKP